MLETMSRKIDIRTLSRLAPAWILLLVLPWATWFDALPWLRLGLALLIFVAPGVAASMFLVGDRFGLLAHVSGGLALSIFLVSSLGLLGRIVHLPFAFIKPVFGVAGLMAFLGLALRIRSGKALYMPKRFGRSTVALLASIVISAIIISFLHRWGPDDANYLAYLTNWQHAQPLNFHLVYVKPVYLDSVRYWLAMLPMSWAFLAQLSRLHGVLLLGFYLGPVLVPLAVLSAFSLYEHLFRSEQRAIAALLVQFIFLLFLLVGPDQQLGRIFFLRITEDKVFAAFILAPVFFVGVGDFLDSPTLRSGLLTLFIGLSLGFVHPIILAYSVFIAGVLAAIVTITRRDYRTLGFAFAVLAITILPSGSLRFVANRAIPFDLESALSTAQIEKRITPIQGTPFYGFNLERIKIQTSTTTKEGLLQAFFTRSYLWLLVIGFLWSVFNLRKPTVMAPFIAATSLLVLVCAIPYTGWLVGYFVSARMLWRAPWLLPIGLIGVTLLEELVNWVAHLRWAGRQPRGLEDPTVFTLLLTVCLVLVGYFEIGVYGQQWGNLYSLGGYRTSLETLSLLGDYLEKNVAEPSVFVAPGSINYFLPGLSSKAKVIVYRRIRGAIPFAVDLSRIGLVLSESNAISLPERLAVLRTYDIRYIIATNPAVKDYYASAAGEFVVSKVGLWWILEWGGVAP